MSYSFILYFFLLISIVISQNKLKCRLEDASTTYARGDSAYICVHFIIENNYDNAYRMAFQVTVDKYTALQAKGIYENFKKFPAITSVGVVVQAESSVSSSEKVTYIKKSTDFINPDVVIPIYSLVITTDNGRITGAKWDNDCFDCTSTCYIDKISDNSTQNNCRTTPCDGTNGTTTACDPKVYISWIGTDSKGYHMDSAGIRISRFRQYSVGQMYSSALNTYDNFLDQAKSQFNSDIQNNLNSLTGGTTPVLTKIIVGSEKFTDNGILPVIYTANGDNVNPPLSWTVPQNTASFAIIVNSTNTAKTHFMVKNIPANVQSISQNSLAGGSAIENSFKKTGYSGPETATSGYKYNFYVYALKISTVKATTVADFYTEIEANKIGWGVLVGVYANSTS